MTKPIGPNWERHESDIAQMFGLSLTPGSGNQFHSPGDVVDNRHPRSLNTPRLILDCKATTKKSFSLEEKMLLEWTQKARELGKSFGLPVRFEERSEGRIRYSDWIVLPLDEFQSVYLGPTDEEREVSVLSPDVRDMVTAKLDNLADWVEELESLGERVQFRRGLEDLRSMLEVDQ